MRSARSGSSSASIGTPTQTAVSGAWSRCASLHMTGIESATPTREAVLGGDAGVRYAADGLPAGVKTPMIVSSRSALVFSTMCTSPRPQPERRARPELLGRLAEVQAARAFGHEDDLVVQVVVPRRLARRDEAGEERRARRAVVRRRRGAGTSARPSPAALRVVEGDVSSRRPIGACRSTPGPTVMTTSSRPSSRCDVASSPASTRAALRAASAVRLAEREHARAGGDVEERVRARGLRRRLCPGCDDASRERERGVGDRRDLAARARHAALDAGSGIWST